MNPCPRCASINEPIDKFCKQCGEPLPGAQGANPPQGGYPPPAAGGFGDPAPAGFGASQGPGNVPRCAQGHEIPPGANFCPFSHPIAIDGMSFGSDQYSGGYGPPQGFGGPGPQGFGTPAGGYGDQPPQYGYNPQQQGYPPPDQGFQPPPPVVPPRGGGTYGDPPKVAAIHQAIPANLQPNALRGFLVSYQANSVGEFWPLTGGRKTVGRANSGEKVDIPLADQTISSRHAALVVDGTAGTIVIEDTGSTNGTYINEEPLGFTGKRDLRDGDKIRFGGFSTIVKIIR